MYILSPIINNWQSLTIVEWIRNQNNIGLTII